MHREKKESLHREADMDASIMFAAPAARSHAPAPPPPAAAFGYMMDASMQRSQMEGLSAAYDMGPMAAGGAGGAGQRTPTERVIEHQVCGRMNKQTKKEKVD
jgi:hypothetical protein